MRVSDEGKTPSGSSRSKVEDQHGRRETAKQDSSFVKEARKVAQERVHSEAQDGGQRKSSANTGKPKTRASEPHRMSEHNSRDGADTVNTFAKTEQRREEWGGGFSGAGGTSGASTFEAPDPVKNFLSSAWNMATAPQRMQVQRAVSDWQNHIRPFLDSTVGSALVSHGQAVEESRNRQRSDLLAQGFTAQQADAVVAYGTQGVSIFDPYFFSNAAEAPAKGALGEAVVIGLGLGDQALAWTRDRSHPTHAGVNMVVNGIAGPIAGVPQMLIGGVNVGYGAVMHDDAAVARGQGYFLEGLGNSLAWGPGAKVLAKAGGYVFGGIPGKALSKVANFAPTREAMAVGGRALGGFKEGFGTLWQIGGEAKASLGQAVRENVSKIADSTAAKLPEFQWPNRGLQTITPEGDLLGAIPESSRPLLEDQIAAIQTHNARSTTGLGTGSSLQDILNALEAYPDLLQNKKDGIEILRLMIKETPTGPSSLDPIGLLNVAHEAAQAELNYFDDFAKASSIPQKLSDIMDHTAHDLAGLMHDPARLRAYATPASSHSELQRVLGEGAKNFSSLRVDTATQNMYLRLRLPSAPDLIGLLPDVPELQLVPLRRNGVPLTVDDFLGLTHSERSAYTSYATLGDSPALAYGRAWAARANELAENMLGEELRRGISQLPESLRPNLDAAQFVPTQNGALAIIEGALPDVLTDFRVVENILGKSQLTGSPVAASLNDIMSLTNKGSGAPTFVTITSSTANDAGKVIIHNSSLPAANLEQATTALRTLASQERPYDITVAIAQQASEAIEGGSVFSIEVMKIVDPEGIWKMTLTGADSEALRLGPKTYSDYVSACVHHATEKIVDLLSDVKDLPKLSLSEAFSAAPPTSSGPIRLADGTWQTPSGNNIPDALYQMMVAAGLPIP